MEEIRAKKSLGQNFLTSEKILSAICAAGEVATEDTILEIGPGKGSLTEKLLETGARVVAVEKDDRLVPLLSEKFDKNPRFTLIHADALEFFATEAFENLPADYKIVANLPYYITGSFLEAVFSSKKPPKLLVLMLQKEVAERIVARDGKESILSMSVKAYGTPKYIQTVDAHYFSPKPAVDSAIIKISAISRDLFTKNELSETAFFETVKQGFAHKRKMLKGNLEISENVLISCGLDPNARAETLTTENWICLSKTTRKNES